MDLPSPSDVATQQHNQALLEAELHRLATDTTLPGDDFATTSVEPLTFSPSDLSHPFLHPYLPSLDDYIDDDFLSCQVNHDGDRVANMSCFNPWNVTPSPPSESSTSSPTPSSSSTIHSSPAGSHSSAFVHSTRQHAAISAAAATAARILQNQKSMSSQPHTEDHPMTFSYSPSRLVEAKRPRPPTQTLQTTEANSAPGSPVSSTERVQGLHHGRNSDGHRQAVQNEIEQYDDESNSDLEAISDDEPMHVAGHEVPSNANTPALKLLPTVGVTADAFEVGTSSLSRADAGDLQKHITTEAKSSKTPSCSSSGAKVATREQRNRRPCSQKEGIGAKGTGEDATLSSFKQRRAEAMERFRKKKAMRRYGRRVRYQIRKRIATTRPRVNGRFARRSDVGAVVAVPSPSSITAL